MAYFSFKKIGTLAILPMIALASIGTEAHAAPKARVLSQSQRGQVSPRSKFKAQQPTTVTECFDDPLTVKTDYQFHKSAEEARQAGIEKWESKAYFMGSQHGQWKYAASKSIETDSKQTFIHNHGWNGSGGGSYQTTWQATVKGTPCRKYEANAPAIP